MQYCLGLDGGGSKTICLLATSEGRIIGRGAAGPANYQVIGVDRAAQAINGSILQAIAAAGRPIDRLASIAVGLAGVDRPADHAVVQSMLDQLPLSLPLRLIDHDATIALAGATLARPGVVIISGTGSIAFGCNHQGDRRRAGGWGPLLGDEGSGYDIGRRALTAVLRAADGRGPATSLGSALLQQLQLSRPEQLVSKVHGEQLSRQAVAALAPLVLAAAAQGDAVAGGILCQAGEELALAAQAVITGLGLQTEQFEVALAGGVLTAAGPLPQVIAQIIRPIAPLAQVISPRFPPVVGALLLALRQAGIELTAAVIDNLKQTLSEEGC